MTPAIVPRENRALIAHSKPADCTSCARLETIGDGVNRRYRCGIGGGYIEPGDLRALSADSMDANLCPHGGPFEREGNNMGDVTETHRPTSYTDWDRTYELGGEQLTLMEIGLRMKAQGKTGREIAGALTELSGQPVSQSSWYTRISDIKRGKIAAAPKSPALAAVARDGDVLVRTEPATIATTAQPAPEPAPKPPITPEAIADTPSADGALTAFLYWKGLEAEFEAFRAGWYAVQAPREGD